MTYTALNYAFEAQVVSPPSVGAVRLDAADQTAVTKMWVSRETDAGADIGFLLDALKVGNRVVIQDYDNSVDNQHYDVTAAPVQLVEPPTGPFIELPVTWVKGGSPLVSTRAILTIISADGPGLPVGGLQDDVLTKQSAADFDAAWVAAQTSSVSVDSTAVDVGRSGATGWPTIDDLAQFTGQSPSDPDLQWALDGGIDYGNLVLGERFVGVNMDSVFRACLDYSASIYSARIGQADVMVESYYGSTPLNRYRRILLANRYTAIA